MCELKKSNSNALGPTHGFMQYFEHLKYLDHFLGVGVGLKMKGVGMYIAEDQFLMSYEYKNKCVNKWNQVLMHCFRGPLPLFFGKT